MSKQFVVVYEAQADFTTATELADRVLLAEIDWLDETLLDSQRHWVGEYPAGSHLTWTSIKNRAIDLRIPIYGDFSGEIASLDARAARRAIRCVRLLLGNVDAIFLIRDMDKQSERRTGLEQARNHDALSTTVVIGTAVVERECWVISGYNPVNEDESKKLATERRRLGFDPRLHSDDLHACDDDQAKRSPKRVLTVLTDGSLDRQRACWCETALSVLKERGQTNGLADYLEDIRQKVVPLITGRKQWP